MALMSIEEKEQDLMDIRDFLEGIHIAAEVMPRNHLVAEPCLLIGLPMEETSEVDVEHMTPDDANLAAGYVTQLDDGENQNTKYLLLYFMVGQELSDADELSVLRLVNEVNGGLTMGCFSFGETQGANGPEKHIQYKLALGAELDSSWEEEVLTEAIVEASIYYDIMKERVAELMEA